MLRTELIALGRGAVEAPCGAPAGQDEAAFLAHCRLKLRERLDE